MTVLLVSSQLVTSLVVREAAETWIGGGIGKVERSSSSSSIPDADALSSAASVASISEEAATAKAGMSSVSLRGTEEILIVLVEIV